tara:strand:+ start:254 stop:385 length:132 start_codon:yes stop_codon:yes gene_type:complete
MIQAKMAHKIAIVSIEEKLLEILKRKKEALLDKIKIYKFLLNN